MLVKRKKSEKALRWNELRRRRNVLSLNYVLRKTAPNTNNSELKTAKDGIYTEHFA